MGVRSVVTAISGAIAASVFGLLLPFAFATLESPALALVWLALALIVSVCVLLAARPITSALARALATLVSRAERSSWSARTANDLARLLVTAGYVVLLQAILRHPLVAVFGVEVDPFVVEAVIGMLALLIVVALLSWMYAVAKPLLEGLATNVLDAALATAPSSESQTLPAAATQTATNDAAPTVLAPKPTAADSQATVVSPKRAAPDDEATQLAPEPAVTIRVEPPSDATEVSG